VAEEIEIIREKLTKNFLMGLPEGLYLVSNTGWSPDQPEFIEEVAPRSGRNEQWKRIVEAHVDQKLCMVFRTRKDYQTFLKRFSARKRVDSIASP
jgi:hypothetical protein